jgi:hypothetical protein
VEQLADFAALVADRRAIGRASSFGHGAQARRPRDAAPAAGYTFELGPVTAFCRGACSPKLP